MKGKIYFIPSWYFKTSNVSLSLLKFSLRVRARILKRIKKKGNLKVVIKSGSKSKESKRKM